MAGTTRQKLLALQTWAAGLNGVSEALLGVPLSVQFIRTVCISVLEGPLNDRTAGKATQERRFLLQWMNETGGDVESAELALCDFLDDLRAQWLLKRRTTNTNDLLRGMTLDDTLANSPEYRPMTGDETRVYPVVIGLTDIYSTGV